MNYKNFVLKTHTDVRGSLCVLENTELPFTPKRLYFIYDAKGTRGGHAHKKEQEFFICLAGSFRARIHDGKKWKAFVMDKPGQALYTNAMVWHEFDAFSKNAIMLAVSSTLYDGQKGYILNHKEFLLCRKKS